MTIELMGRASSLNVQKVMWALAEAGQSYTRIDIGGPFGGNNTPEYLAHTPSGQIPTLRDGDLVMFESNACVRQVARAYGDGNLMPDQPGLADQWMDWTSLNLNVTLTSLFMATVRTPRSKIDHAKVGELAKVMANQAKIADGALAGKSFLVEERLTMADIVLGANLYRYFSLEFDREETPNLSRYYAMLSERPAYQENVMVSYEPMRVPDE